MTRPAAIAIASSLFFAAACSSTTESCVPSTTMIGTWSYRAQRDAPVPGTINGTLVIESQRCEDIHGVMDVVETVAGESRRLTGQLSGTLIENSFLRFDVTLNQSQREHLARVSADSLAGSWVETTNGNGSGAFSARREQQ